MLQKLIAIIINIITELNQINFRGANGNGSQKRPTNKGLAFKTLSYDLSCKLHTLGH